MIQGNEYKGLLQVGQVVYSMLYGGRSGVIVSITGEQKPETIRDLGGIVMGGSAHLVIVFEDGTKSTVPEAIVRGVQWGIRQAVASPMQVEALIAYAKQVAKEREQAKVEGSRRKEQEKADLPNQCPFLVPLSKTPGKSRWATGAANLRKHLAREFPGVKFSVKSKSYSGGSSIDVYWTDGPSTREAEKIGNLYEQGHFDSMVDCYYFDDEMFPEVFGGARYVSASRTISDEAFSQVAVEMGWPEAGRDHKFGGFTGCEIDTGEMIQRECWGRSF